MCNCKRDLPKRVFIFFKFSSVSVSELFSVCSLPITFTVHPALEQDLDSLLIMVASFSSLI